MSPTPNKEIAKHVILAYLGQTVKAENVYTVYQIQNGDDELLLEHIKALKNIFDNAIKEMWAVEKGFIKDERAVEE